MDMDNDLVKTFTSRNADSLAKLREKTLLEISEIKDNMHDYSHGVAIGISPTDKVLNELDRGELTHLLTKIFKNIRIKGQDGKMHHMNLDVYLVAEYSPKAHRLHYHGVICVDNITILTNIKRRIQKVIGRVVTEQIRNYKEYIDYMFKQYVCEEHGVFYNWNMKECVVMVSKTHN